VQSATLLAWLVVIVLFLPLSNRSREQQLPGAASQLWHFEAGG
jgi:hypothetical protein